MKLTKLNCRSGICVLQSSTMTEINCRKSNRFTGTSRPTDYHVLHKEIGFSANDLHELVHFLSYVYQRSTTAVSVVAPICYARLAATQMSQFIKFNEMSNTSSSHDGEHL
ncbi:protein argonaute 4A-like [Citrus clementina]|uniref:protein argonaute 4A-like n=1 Tax=Citrus clementina TaxID=85681 RepID=UPI0003D73894|nr:protein argonaute 4A-like [Citrus x clementina]